MMEFEEYVSTEFDVYLDRIQARADELGRKLIYDRKSLNNHVIASLHTQPNDLQRTLLCKSLLSDDSSHPFEISNQPYRCSPDINESYQLSPSQKQNSFQQISLQKRYLRRHVRQASDPQMEFLLSKWVYQNQHKTQMTHKIIREKAKLFSTKSGFKASKGWLEKYFRRNPNVLTKVNDKFKESTGISYHSQDIDIYEPDYLSDLGKQ